MSDVPPQDLLELFEVLDGQARELGQHSILLPETLTQNFVKLAKIANELDGVDLDLPASNPSSRTPERFLIHVGYAIETMRRYVRRNTLPSTEGGMPTQTSISQDTGSALNNSKAKTRHRPRVFIGCSTEGLRYAKVIQLQLQHSAATAIWSQGVFGLSQGTLETLVAQCATYDYAILVLTADDMRTKREESGAIPRDNVIFELGLFMGALGRERVFMVVQAGTDLPTDLAGISPATFDASSEHINVVSALGPVTTMLEIAMNLI